MKKLLVCISTLFIFYSAHAQNPDIVWSKTYGGSDVDEARCILQTGDGGFIVGGNTFSSDGDVTGLHGELDAWVLKLNSAGEIEWEKTYGGSNEDGLLSLKVTSDSGYILMGQTYSSDDDISGNHGDGDGFIIKLNSTGEIDWQKCYGGTGPDGVTDIAELPGGGFIFAGETSSSDGDVSFSHGDWDAWIVRINSSGNIVWEKTYGGSNEDAAESIEPTSDGGFIIGGETESADGDLSNSGFHGGSDLWVFKIDSLGQFQWSKCHGGSLGEFGGEVRKSNDGNFYFSGISNSNDGDVISTDGIEDCWVGKIDTVGNILWQRTLGGSLEDNGTHMTQTGDHGYLISATTSSHDGDVTFNHSNNIFNYSDAWIVKLDSSGVLQWQYSYGGSLNDEASSSIQCADGSYVFAGRSSSNDFDVPFNHGLSDVWIVKLSPFTFVPTLNSDQQLSVYPNPSGGIIYVDVKDIESASVDLLNCYGQLVYHSIYQSNSKTAIDAKHFPRGLYYLRLQSGSKTEIRKVVLQ